MRGHESAGDEKRDERGACDGGRDAEPPLEHGRGETEAEQQQDGILLDRDREEGPRGDQPGPAREQAEPEQEDRERVEGLDVEAVLHCPGRVAVQEEGAPEEGRGHVVADDPARDEKARGRSRGGVAACAARARGGSPSRRVRGRSEEDVAAVMPR